MHRCKKGSGAVQKSPELSGDGQLCGLFGAPMVTRSLFSWIYRFGLFAKAAHRFSETRPRLEVALSQGQLFDNSTWKEFVRISHSFEKTVVMQNVEQGNETTRLVQEKVPINENATLHRFPSILDDAMDTVKLGVPIFIAMVSWVGVSKRKYQLKTA